MNLISFLQEMLVLYAIGLVGFLACKKEILNQHTVQVLTQLILSITLPFLILHAMGQPYQFKMTGTLFWLIPISVFILFLSILLAILLRKTLNLPADRKQVFEGLIIFGNQGFIGFSLLSSIFPEQGPLYVSLFNLPYLILIWTYGIYLFVGNKETIPWKKIFFNPGILATLIGLAVFLLPFHWPATLAAIFQTVGSTTIPLSMLLIGALLANMNFHLHLLKERALWIVTAARLLVIPLLLFPLIWLNLPFPILATAILVSATPAAPTIALYAGTYGGDVNLAAVGSAWTTLLSIVTIPSLYLLLSYIYYL